MCAHVDEFVDEEESAFKHFLVEEDASSGLCGHDEEHREQVGCQSWPWCVGDGHDGAVDEGVDLIGVMPWYDDVVMIYIDADT